MTEQKKDSALSSADPAQIRYRLSGQSEFLQHEPGENGDRLRDHLRTSLQMQHLLVLCGSGTSIEAGGPSMPALWTSAQALAKFADACNAVSHSGQNIEEFLSRCDAFLELTPDDTTVRAVRKGTIETILSECRKAGQGPSNLVSHKELLKKFARRRARDSRAKLFTTNYDTCFERAAAELGLVPIDGFSFTNPRHFDPRFFEYDIVKRTASSEVASFVPGVIHYHKLHGSVDWLSRDGRIEVDPHVAAENACLIYPARAKFQRSYEQPHLELMARYLAALREPNTCMVVVGFGFNDVHLYHPILAALRSNPHFRLVVVSRKVGERLADVAADTPWVELRELAPQADISFVASSFSNFVGLIPDLAALSPAHELEAAVLRITGKER